MLTFVFTTINIIKRKKKKKLKKRKKKLESLHMINPSVFSTPTVMKVLLFEFPFIVIILPGGISHVDS
jgi:hypothetical protein